MFVSETVNPALEMAENIFRRLIWEPLIQAGLQAMFVAVPWTNVWPIRPLINGVVNIFQGYAFKAAKLYTDLTDLKFMSAEHQAAFDKASLDLKLIAHAKGPDSDEFKKELDEQAHDLSRFTQFNG